MYWRETLWRQPELKRSTALNYVVFKTRAAVFYRVLNSCAWSGFRSDSTWPAQFIIHPWLSGINIPWTSKYPACFILTLTKAITSYLQKFKEWKFFDVQIYYTLAVNWFFKCVQSDYRFDQPISGPFSPTFYRGGKMTVVRGWVIPMHKFISNKE